MYIFGIIHRHHNNATTSTFQHKIYLKHCPRLEGWTTHALSAEWLCRFKYSISFLEYDLIIWLLDNIEKYRKLKTNSSCILFDFLSYTLSILESSNLFYQFEVLFAFIIPYCLKMN